MKIKAIALRQRQGSAAMLRWFSGGGIIDKMADEIGINRKLLKRALSADGVSFATYKAQMKFAEQTFGDASDQIRHAIVPSLNPAYRGLLRLELRFGATPSISEGIMKLTAYALLHDPVEDRVIRLATDCA